MIEEDEFLPLGKELGSGHFGQVLLGVVLVRVTNGGGKLGLMCAAKVCLILCK